MTELLSCPFCGGGETIVQEGSKYWAGNHYVILTWDIRHWCADKTEFPISTRVLTFSGRTEEEAIKRWNHRV